MDRNTVYTLALARIGQDHYREGSPTAAACERWYQFILRRAGARYNWTFAKRAALLNPLPGRADDPAESVRYPMPADCLKLVRFETPDGREVTTPRVFGDAILIPREQCPNSLRVEYQSDLTALKGELPDNAPEFCDGVIALLSARLAMELTGNAQLSQALEQESERHFAGAIATDRQQDWSIGSKPSMLRERRVCYYGAS